MVMPTTNLLLRYVNHIGKISANSFKDSGYVASNSELFEYDTDSSLFHQSGPTSFVNQNFMKGEFSIESQPAAEEGVISLTRSKKKQKLSVFPSLSSEFKGLNQSKVTVYKIQVIFCFSLFVSF